MKRLLVVFFLLGVSATKAKEPIPDESALEKAMALVKEVYGPEYAAAESLEQKQTFAKKLIDKAAGADSATRFALLKVARDSAIQAKDGLTAFQAVDQLARTFDVDQLNMKASVLHSFLDKAKLRHEYASIVPPCNQLVDEAVKQDRIETAQKIMGMAMSSARDTRDSALIKATAAKSKALSEIVAAFKKYQEALKILEVDPTNPKANLEAGQYVCFVKRNWEEGRLMLAIGGDEGLKTIAAKEIEEKTSDVELGDIWWDLFMDRNDEGFKKRALYWYTRALPGLAEGIQRDKVKQRMKAGQEPGEMSHPVLGYPLRSHPSDAIKFGGHWYKIVSTKTTWSEAKDQCRKMGGYLACVTSSEEHDFISKLGRHVWLGGYAREGTWMWINGEPMKSTFWHPGEPNRDHARYILTGRSGRWYDGPEKSEHTRGFVCEWDD